MEELQSKFSEAVVAFALRNMVLNEEFREIKGKKNLIRER
jgi:hypothetical protein